MCFGIDRSWRNRNESTNRHQDSFGSSLSTLNEKKSGYDVEFEFNSGNEKERFSSEGVSYSTIEDVRETVLALQQQRSMSSRYQQFGRKVEPILDFCTKYTGVMNTVSQADGSAMLIWGALKAVIEVARTSIAYFRFIENALSKLGDTLSLSHEYEKMLGEEARVRIALTNLYDEIYLFVKRLQISVSASSWTVFLKNVRKSYDAEFKNSLDQIERYIAKFNDEVTLAHRQGLARGLTGLSENSSAILDKVTSREAQDSEAAILQWLKAFDAEADLQRAARRRTPGTGAWLLNHESLKTWETPKNNRPVIWINGPPGFGKTVLSSHLIQYLQNSHKLNFGIHSAPTVLYFYCDSGNSERKTSLDVYAAVLSQIVIQTRSVPVHLLDVYERAKKYSRSHVSDSDNLSTVLKEAIENLSTVYIVLDGLDECEDPSEVVSVFDDIARSSATCQLACFSRKLPSIERVLYRAMTISLDSSVVQQDINTYLLEAVGDLPAQSKCLHQEIIQTVSEKADGMFLFAYLNLQALKLTVNQEGMKSALAKIPSGLDEIYSGIISQISSQDIYRQQLAYKTLLWVSCSTRPLLWRELQYALSWEETDRTFSEDRRPFKDAVLELCSPLVEYRADKDTFHLTHYSLYEYLMNISEKARLPQAAQKFIFDPLKAHQEISYVLLTCLNSKGLARTVKVDAVQNPLASYATTEWCHHLSSSKYTPDLYQTYKTFTSVPVQRSVWIMRFLLLNRQSFPLQKITNLQKSVQSWEHNVKETSLYYVEDLVDIQRALIGLDQFDPNVKAETISPFERDLIVRDLARSYTMAGKLEQGIAMFTTALKRSQTGAGEQTHEHAWILNSLGILYDQQGKTELAKSLEEQALRCQERSLPQDHLDITLTVNELGRMARHLGQYQEAEAFHLRALRTLRLHLPDSDLQIIWTINTLARSYRREGRLEEAINLHRQALQGQQKTLGEDHPHTLWTMGDIARCLRDQGQYADAVEIISKVHSSRQRVLGPLHPDTLWTLNDVGLLYCSLGDKENAKMMHQRAYDGQVQVLGVSHAHTQWTAQELSQLV